MLHTLLLIAVEATSFLLNLQAWDFLSVLEVRQNGHFQVVYLLI